MADHSMLSQLVQIGLEATAGGGGPSNRKVTNLQIELSPQGDFTEYRGAGHKFVDSVVPGDEWASGSASGPLGFGEALFPLASIVNKATPTGPDGDGAYTWTFNNNPTGPDVIATYTVEKGDGTANFKWNYVYFNELTIKANRKEASFSGTVMGQTMLAGVTPTPAAAPPAWTAATALNIGAVRSATSGHATSYYEVTAVSGSAPYTTHATTEPTWTDVSGATFVDNEITWTRRAFAATTTVENVIVVPQRFDLFYVKTLAEMVAAGRTAADYANGATPSLDDLDIALNRTQITRAFDWEFKLGNRFSTFFPMVSALTSYAGIVEQAADATLGLRVGMDTISGDFVAPMTLAKMRAGDPVYLRLQANGPLIGGTTYYHFHQDVSAVVNQPLKWEDQNGLVVNGWDMRVVNDPSAGYPFQIVIINKTAAL